MEDDSEIFIHVVDYSRIDYTHRNKQTSIPTNHVLLITFRLILSYVINIFHFCIMSSDWNNKAKQLLKSELVRRGFTTGDLVQLLARIGVQETKASVDSKISRGTFSAAFLIQCLNAIGCKSFVPEISADMIQEPGSPYKKKNQA